MSLDRVVHLKLSAPLGLWQLVNSQSNAKPFEADDPPRIVPHDSHGFPNQVRKFWNLQSKRRDLHSELNFLNSKSESEPLPKSLSTASGSF